ncbi:MAG: hypothetical protein K2Q10_12920, partial [Rhodospirillales bacterium]|nr:hypothetical protein [Rhodospirillales bacterium]
MAFDLRAGECPMVKAVRMSVAALAAAWPLATQAAEFDRVIVFGDSLSDVGNLYTATAGQQPLSPPYADGRFSNGPVWAEYLRPGIRGSTAGITATGSLDYAFGGATTGSGQAIPGLLDQVGLFQADKAAGRTALGGRDAVVVWAGANDYFTVLPTLPSADPTGAA